MSFFSTRQRQQTDLKTEFKEELKQGFKEQQEAMLALLRAYLPIFFVLFEVSTAKRLW
jgi:hypothetical protein